MALVGSPALTASSTILFICIHKSINAPYHYFYVFKMVKTKSNWFHWFRDEKGYAYIAHVTYIRSISRERGFFVSIANSIVADVVKKSFSCNEIDCQAHKQPAGQFNLVINGKANTARGRETERERRERTTTRKKQLKRNNSSSISPFRFVDAPRNICE